MNNGKSKIVSSTRSVRELHDRSIGALIRDWRLRGKKSQLDVSMEVGLSTRHLSFLETDKARPSEPMLLALMTALDVPEAERNLMFVAAGFRPRPFSEEHRRADAVDVQGALRTVLERSGDLPVLVKDAIWNIVGLNACALAAFNELLGNEVDLAGRTANVLELVFDPLLLRSKIRNWDEAASRLVSRIRRERAFAAEDAGLEALLASVSRFPGFLERWNADPGGENLSASIAYRIDHDGRELHFEAVLTSLGSPYDAVLRGVRIDTFYPRNSGAEQFLAEIRAPRP